MREPILFESPLCAEIGPEVFFPDKDESYAGRELAKKICGNCLHKDECLEWGLHREYYGIWGGATENERRALRRKLNIRVKEVVSFLP